MLDPIGQELTCGMADYKGRKVEDTPAVCNALVSENRGREACLCGGLIEKPLKPAEDFADFFRFSEICHGIGQ